MEGVDHVHIAQICGGGLVCQVYRVIQRQIPNREGLKLGIACPVAPLMLMVQLAQTGGQLAAAGAGGGDHYQLAGGLHIFVTTVAVFRNNVGDIGGVTGNVIVMVDLYAHGLQTGLEGIHHRMGLIAGQYHAGYI